MFIYLKNYWVYGNFFSVLCGSAVYMLPYQFWWFRYQAQLQKNLMYLAAIADAQPQAPTMPPQVTVGMILLFLIPHIAHILFICVSNTCRWPRTLHCNKEDITCNTHRQQQWLSNQVFSPQSCPYNLITHIRYRINSNSCTSSTSSTSRPSKGKWE